MGLLVLILRQKYNPPLLLLGSLVVILGISVEILDGDLFRRSFSSIQWWQA